MVELEGTEALVGDPETGEDAAAVRWRHRREQILPGVVSGPTEKGSLPLALPGPGGQRSYPPTLRVSIALPKER